MAQVLVPERRLPWEEVGVEVDGLMTAREALVKAELDWEVEKRPVFIASGSNGRGRTRIPGQVASVRVHDEYPLGVTGSVHTLVQNLEAFEWGDEIVADMDGANWHWAGSLRGGRMVFMALTLPKSVIIPGDDGKVLSYLLITNGHDGKRSLEAAVTAIRDSCTNALNVTLQGAPRRIILRHATRIDERMANAAETLGMTYRYMDALQATGERLVKKSLVEKQVEEILRKVWPVPETFDNPERIDQTDFARALKTWRTSDNIANVRGTAWGVLQAVAEYIDHGQEYRARRWSPADTKMRSIAIGGVAMGKKNKALRVLEAV